MYQGLISVLDSSCSRALPAGVKRACSCCNPTFVDAVIGCVCVFGYNRKEFSSLGLSSPERFQLVDEAFEWSKWLENSTLSLSHSTNIDLEGRKHLSESLKPIGFGQVF
jgi:hypothetical protein